MQAAARSARSTSPRVDEAAARRPTSSRPSSCTSSLHAPAVRPVAEDHAARRPASCARSAATAGTSAGHALLRDVAAGEHDQRLGGPRLARLERSRVLALEHGDLPAHATLAQPARVQAREAERALRNAQAQRLDRVADPAARPARGTRSSSSRLHTSCQSTTSRKPRSGRERGRRPAARSTGNEAVWTTS